MYLPCMPKIRLLTCPRQVNTLWNPYFSLDTWPLCKIRNSSPFPSSTGSFSGNRISVAWIILIRASARNFDDLFPEAASMKVFISDKLGRRLIAVRTGNGIMFSVPTVVVIPKWIYNWDSLYWEINRQFIEKIASLNAMSLDKSGNCQNTGYSSPLNNYTTLLALFSQWAPVGTKWRQIICFSKNVLNTLLSKKPSRSTTTSSKCSFTISTYFCTMYSAVGLFIVNNPSEMFC